MQVFEDLASFKKHFQHCVATIGKYDGMHLGHQGVLSSVLDQAQSLGLPSVVVLSEPQPEEFFAGAKAPVRLNHFHDKVAFLDEFGIDAVYRMNFDKNLSQLSARSFIDDILVKGLGIKSLIVGDDFRFGKGREGDYGLLQSVGQEVGFKVSSEDSCLLAGDRVSSTLVREQLEKGDCEKVKTLLGRHYSISGEVVKGQQLGRQLGAPTANIKIKAHTIPLRGVYAVEARLGGRKLFGAANVGYRPTIEENLEPNLEVYLFDFNEDIYGETLSVSFVKKIRDEKKFSSLDELKEHIAADIQQAKSLFSIS